MVTMSTRQDYVKTKPYVKVYQDTGGEWRWTLFACNHKVIADSGEGYKTKWGCKRAAKKFLGL